MYKATLFHPEGDSVTDFSGNKTKEDVWDAISNMGSRWVFYPIAFITTEKTVVGTPEGLEFLQGKRIKTVRKYLKLHWNIKKEAICEAINNGVPLDCIYTEV